MQSQQVTANLAQNHGPKKTHLQSSTQFQRHTLSIMHINAHSNLRPTRHSPSIMPDTPLLLTHARPSIWHARNQAQSKQEQSMRVCDKLPQHLCATLGGSHDNPAR
jgi:hypothetical protein